MPRKTRKDMERGTSRSPENKRGGNKGIKAARVQQRRERAYERGAERPREDNNDV